MSGVPSVHLAHFVAAQDEAGTYDRALAELRAGRKRSHWMWFVFPQIAGLGQSAISRRYAIDSLADARAYLAHPVLGPRLRECAATLLDLDPDLDAVTVLGSVDALKLCSSMTLFALADPAETSFERVLARFCAGERDRSTERLLSV